MEYTRTALEALAFETAPHLDSTFLTYETEEKQNGSEPLPVAVEQRQPAYAQRCRELYSRMTQQGSRDHHLSQGISKSWLSVPSSVDGFDIPVMQLDLSESQHSKPAIVILYYHGGGLAVGEADSEELTCRRMLKAGLGHVRLYSVGYRLRVPHGAEKCVSDAQDCFEYFRKEPGKLIIAGSSSGGQLAATVSQSAPKGSIHGVMLRGPVTGDARSGLEYIPERLRRFHTSVSSPSFLNSMSFYLGRDVPRDGLKRLPIEADVGEFSQLPKTWIQICTNDTLYSDGLCYALALKEAGVNVRLDVIHGWPHTFWLPAPHLARSAEAEDDMMTGLRWLAE